MKSFSSHWSPLTIWSLCFSDPSPIVPFTSLYSIRVLLKLASAVSTFLESWNFIVEHTRMNNESSICVQTKMIISTFSDRYMSRPHFCYLFVSLLVRCLKEEKGKSCTKSASSLPVNASIMSCTLASLPADAASRFRVCAALVGLFWA